MMIDNKGKYKILLISSKPPYHSAGLGQQIIDALTEFGHEVKFLTRYKYKNIKDNESYIEKRGIVPVIIQSIKHFSQKIGILNVLQKSKKIIYEAIGKSSSGFISNNGLTFCYYNENNPDTNIDDLLESIVGSHYDAIITLFWEKMLNSLSIKALYRKFKCPILILSPDMAPMTGGCVYYGKCSNYKTGCGKCPALNSSDPSDQSYKNFLRKRENYKNVNCAFLGNTWMNQNAEMSGLFKNIFKSEIIIDDRIFYPADKESIKDLRDFLKYKFIILLRSTAAPRKGNNDIFQAIKIFLERISNFEKQELLVLTIGNNYFKSISFELPCDVINFGQVDQETLIKCYQISSIFLNASYDDAGPSMINQAIMCGTPVVCYDNGAAVDVIENNISGFKVTTGDVAGLAESVNKVYRLSSKEYLELSIRTRAKAEKHNSPRVFSENITQIIRRLSS